MPTTKKLTANTRASAAAAIAQTQVAQTQASQVPVAQTQNSDS